LIWTAYWAVTKRKRLVTASRTGFVNHRFPDSFGFENEFNGFTDRSPAGKRFRNVMRGPFYFGDGIANSNSEASPPHQGNVGKIVADKGNGRIGDTRVSQDFFIGWHLHWLFHVDKFHLHFMGAAQECSAFSTRDTSRAKASRLRQGEPLAVV